MNFNDWLLILDEAKKEHKKKGLTNISLKVLGEIKDKVVKK